MGTSPHHHHPQHLHHKFPIQKLITRALYCLLPLAIIHLYFFPLPFNRAPLPTPHQPHISTISIPPPQVTQKHPPPTSSNHHPSNLTNTHSFPAVAKPIQQSPLQAAEVNPKPKNASQCDYSTGRWVSDPSEPLYNSSSCSTIKPGQNCAAHGRPDSDFLHWRWQPNTCKLDPFSPVDFLNIMKNKHLAFVGDSMARNQLESLLCMLSSASAPTLVFASGEENKFRRYTFPVYNTTVSLFWSPFLVSGVEKKADINYSAEKTADTNYNKLFLDKPEPTWAMELERIDMVVFSVGHWFLHPAVFYENGAVIGCHHCPIVNVEMNYTETGFFNVFRKAVRTAVSAAGVEVKRVVVTTFSPAHFEGEWDKVGACSKTKPYEGERELEYMDAEMRRVEVEEVAAAAERGGGGLRIAALDVTRMAMMRPDGHPGAYMNPNPFAGGVKDRVQNDCVHWCLPGPIDAWNAVLLAVMKGWEDQR